MYILKKCITSGAIGAIGRKASTVAATARVTRSKAYKNMKKKLNEQII